MGMSQLIKFVGAVLLLLNVSLSWSMAPPRPGEIKDLQSQGLLQERLDSARTIGNHLLSGRSIDTLRWRIKRARGDTDISNTPPPAWANGLPSTGSPKILVLLVDFSDFPADGSNTPSSVAARMFTSQSAGSSSDPLYPYESLRAFYQRSSYGALNIQGNVTAWYRAQHPRSYYSNLGQPNGNTALIDEALTALEATGHNFAQYDNNGDGYIDNFHVKWTGPDTGWSSFWWAYQWSYFGSKVVSGVRPRNFIWSWIMNPAYTPGQTSYLPQVDIHETGHALGLPDYYDYDDTVGPDGGLGRLDMMDGNWGDHNTFSKMVLGWLTPTVVSTGSLNKSLAASGTSADAVLLMPGATSSTVFSEFFLAQYRKRGSGNDPANYPSDGISLWHIDSTLNAGGTDYQFNNSLTSHKLIRLIQADGMAQIENQSALADANDFYVSGRTFGPSTNPSSASYGGIATNASLTAIGVAGGSSIAATFAVGGTGLTLTVTKAGAGTGTVTSSPAGINCGADCTENYASGTLVTLTATPAAGSTFAGWSGSCVGTGSCVVSMTAARAVTANFNGTVSGFLLTVSKAGAGTGTVTSSPAGINCGADCTENYASGTLVTLTATPAAGSTFAGWSGSCVGTGSCVVSMTAARAVTANFNGTVSGFLLTVSKAGAGTGTVTSSPAGINCGADCTENYASGTLVTLTATPAAGSTFAGWSGSCVGTGSCVVSMTAARAVTANFNGTVSGFLLTVSKAGAGTGTVTSSPAGINCGADCTENYASGTLVTLTATPAAGSTFAGWSGSCVGTGSCVVSMTAARAVTANFNGTVSGFLLTVSKAGAGTGTVTSSPAGINCGADCTENYASGTLVTLTATPAAGSTFAGWSGSCVGTGSCVVSMTAARAVTANFNGTVSGFLLTVSKAGAGTGTVTSSPAGINCGADCTENYASGTLVTLTATPAAGSTFAGWSGSCVGTGSCVVSMTAARAVTANFNGTVSGFLLTVSKAGAGTGTVTSSPAGINCGADCTENYASGTLVTLTATPAAGSTFAGWSGSCVGTGSCVVSMTAAQSVAASFNSGGVALIEALDNPALVWTTGGNATWSGQTGTALVGGDAAQSGGPMGDNTESWIQTTVTGPGILTFMWKVSSEVDYDFLRFYVNGVEQSGSISGEVAWTHKAWQLPAGTHILKWVFTKDVSFSGGADAAWVDQVYFFNPVVPQ